MLVDPDLFFIIISIPQNKWADNYIKPHFIFDICIYIWHLHFLYTIVMEIVWLICKGIL